MEKLDLNIVTPTRKLFSGSVSDLLIPGHKSELGILNAHADLVGLTVTGLVRFDSEGEQKRFAIKSGFIQVSEDSILVMADDAVSQTEKNDEELMAEVKDIEEKLVSGEVGIEERETLFIQRDWLQALQAL